MNSPVRFIASIACIALAGGCMGTDVPDWDDSSSASKAARCELPASADEMCSELLAQINYLRADAGLEPLSENATLAHAADDFACQMVEEDFFAHEQPGSDAGPGDRLIDAGYIFFAMGENLAAGQINVDEVIIDWMSSPGHRANILTPEWRETGIAVRSGGRYGAYWVQEFAEPVELSSEIESVDQFGSIIAADAAMETDAGDRMDPVVAADPSAG